MNKIDKINDLFFVLNYKKTYYERMIAIKTIKRYIICPVGLIYLSYNLIYYYINIINLNLNLIN